MGSNNLFLIIYNCVGETNVSIYHFLNSNTSAKLTALIKASRRAN